MRCTIDASVFVAAARPQDVHHAASRMFLRRVRTEGVAAHCPALVLAECAAAVARHTGSARAAGLLVRAVQRTRCVHLVVLELTLARRAAELAAALRLRGADSEYVAVAEAFNAILVTWDGEMLQRGPAAAPTMTPSDWLARQAARP